MSKRLQSKHLRQLRRSQAAARAPIHRNMAVKDVLAPLAFTQWCAYQATGQAARVLEDQAARCDCARVALEDARTAALAPSTRRKVEQCLKHLITCSRLYHDSEERLAITAKAATEAARALEEQTARCDAAEAALEDARRAGLAFHRAEALAALSPSKAAATAGAALSGRVRAGQEGREQGEGARALRPLGAEKLLRHMRERLRRLDGDVGKFALKAASAKVRRGLFRLS